MDPYTQKFEFKPVPFKPPVPKEVKLSSGATVLLLEDKALPLVNLFMECDTGYVHAPEPLFGSAYALDDMLRTGGTTRLTPAAVDLAIETQAMGLEIEMAQRSTSAGLNVISRQLESGVRLLAELLSSPRFDAHNLDVWKGKQAEVIHRRNDRPGPIAHRYFGRLMYQGHILSRILELSDLEEITEDRLREAHRRLVQPEHMTIGVSGDFEEDQVLELLEELFTGWPKAPPLDTTVEKVNLRRDGGIFVIDRPLAQTSIVVGQPGYVQVGNTKDYFASRVLNFILGSSGFTSRLTREMRTVRGYAYSARTSWSAAIDDQRALLAVTETKPDSTVPALELIHEIWQGFIDAPPSEEEVRVAQDNMRHSFLFEFEMASQIVHRQVGHRSRNLPPDWFECYLQGIQSITAEDVHEAAQKFLKPDELSAVLVGDLKKFEGALSRLGDFTTLELEA